jgi:hypothetical protein
MRRRLTLVLVVMASLSCSAAIHWNKPGVSEGERQRDETECTARASRESSVPTASTVGTTPGTPYDPQRSRVEAYDPGVFDECMRTRGYERVPARPPA